MNSTTDARRQQTGHDGRTSPTDAAGGKPITGPGYPSHYRYETLPDVIRVGPTPQLDVAARVLTGLLRYETLPDLLDEPPHGKPELTPTGRRLVVLAKLLADELCGPAAVDERKNLPASCVYVGGGPGGITFERTTFIGPDGTVTRQTDTPIPSLFTADLTADQLVLLRWVRDGEGHRRHAWERAPVTDEERAVYARKLQKLGLLATFADGTGYGLKLTPAGAVVLGVS